MNLTTIIISHLTNVSLLIIFIITLAYACHKLVGWKFDKKIIFPLILLTYSLTALRILEDILRMHGVQKKIIGILAIGTWVSFMFITFFLQKKKQFPR